jgi:hypothetical protein
MYYLLFNNHLEGQEMPIDYKIKLFLEKEYFPLTSYYEMFLPVSFKKIIQ